MHRWIQLVAVVALSTISKGGDDPSLFPVRSLTDSSVFAERLRLLADFDRDGLVDMALSEPVEDFGRMGGIFEVYVVSTEGAWSLVGVLIAHPKAISLESSRKPAHTRLWTYLRGGGSFGGLGFFEISRQRVADFEGIEITPGDGGTSTGNAMYQAVFARSELPVVIEQSETDENGLVQWVATVQR